MRSSGLGPVLLGIAVAIATAVLWVSLGIRTELEGELRALVDQVGANVFYVVDRGTTGFSEEDRGEVEALPEVEDVAGEGTESTGYLPDQPYTLTQLEVSANYVEAMRLSLTAGRGFAPGDHQVAVIGWEVKEELFGDSDPVGATIFVAGSECRIIGVLAPIPAGDFLRNKLNRLVLVPLGTRPQFPGIPAQKGYWALAVRARDVAVAKAAVERLLPGAEIRPIHEAYSIYFYTERLLSQAMLISSLMIFLVVGITITGLVSVAALEQAWECGVRRAVGATQGDIFSLLVGQGAKLAGVGALAGSVLGWALFPVFARLGQSPALGPLHGAVIPFVLAVGILASLYPAWRNARLLPAQALSLRTLEARRVYGVKVVHLTAALTLAIGVGSLFLLLAVNSGSREELQLLWGRMDEWTFFVAAPTRRPILSPPELSPTDAPALASLPGVEVVIPMVFFPAAHVQGPRGIATVQLSGVDKGFELLPLLNIEQGRALTREEIAHGAKVAVMAEDLAIKLFGEESPLGKTVSIESEDFHVVGVFSQNLGMLSTMGAALIVPYGATTGLWVEHAFWVMASSQEQIVEVEKSVVGLLQRLHPGRAKVEITNLAREREEGMANVGRLLGQLGLLSGAGLALGAAALFNLTSLLLLLRTREMGIRRAVGASRRHMLALGMSEALKICVVAWAGGVGLGVGVAAILGRFRILPPAKLEPAQLAITLAAAMALAALAGSWPAWRASQLPPAEALRR